MEIITLSDLVLINNLSSRIYTQNRLLSNATENENNHLKVVKNKLKGIADYFSDKYDEIYGPFESSVSTGNPIAIGGTRFNHVWAGLFKGATNKQYAAQISFVMNPQDTCLNVGFYFGRASGHNLNHDQKIKFEQQLTNLGVCLSDSINSDSILFERYNSLFDFGFIASSNGNIVSPDEWYRLIRSFTKSSQIVAKIYPNDFGIIENSIIDSFVSQIIFLMGAIREDNSPLTPVQVKPLTPEQSAKRAERLAQIGLKGELYALEYERNKLSALGITHSSYPRHVALESTHYGYDILSLDEHRNEIYIEVKTTTRNQEDTSSRIFYLTNNEFDVFSNQQQSYKLYRVYNIENSPSIEILDLNYTEKNPDGYIVTY